MPEAYQLQLEAAFQTVRTNQRLAVSMIAASLLEFVHRYDTVLYHLSLDSAETLVAGNIPLSIKEIVVKELFKVWKRNAPANECAEKIIYKSVKYWPVFDFSLN